MNAYIEVQAKVPSQEAEDSIQDLLKQYVDCCEQEMLCVDIVDDQYLDEPNIWKSLVLKVEGTNAFELLQAQARDAEPDSSTLASIYIYPEVSDDTTLVVDEKEVLVEYFHKNIVDNSMISHTDCNVRLTHIPTGTMVQCQRDRARAKNHAEAMQMLKSRLLAL